MEQPAGEFVWMLFFDAIHHRGQLSAYLRPMGGKVPSIYGPSGGHARAVVAGLTRRVGQPLRRRREVDPRRGLDLLVRADGGPRERRRRPTGVPGSTVTLSTSSLWAAPATWASSGMTCCSIMTSRAPSPGRRVGLEHALQRHGLGAPALDEARGVAAGLLLARAAVRLRQLHDVRVQLALHLQRAHLLALDLGRDLRDLRRHLPFRLRDHGRAPGLGVDDALLDLLARDGEVGVDLGHLGRAPVHRLLRRTRPRWPWPPRWPPPSAPSPPGCGRWSSGSRRRR